MSKKTAFSAVFAVFGHWCAIGAMIPIVDDKTWESDGNMHGILIET